MSARISVVTPLVLYETLGPTLGAGNEGAAAMWGLAQTCFLNFPESVRRAGFADGNELFDAVFTHAEGVTFTVDEYDATLTRLDHADGRVHLVVDELIEELASLTTNSPVVDPEFPFVLSAGERRSSTANTIFRDHAWRKKDPSGALRIHPDDAGAVGVDDGGRFESSTGAASVVATVELTDTMRPGT